MREKAENQSLYDGIHSEAGHLEDKSDIATEVAHINEQWAAICQATEERGQLLRAVAESWSFYSDSSAEAHELIKRLEVEVQQQPNIHAIDVSTLRAELDSYKVRRNGRNMRVLLSNLFSLYLFFFLCPTPNFCDNGKRFKLAMCNTT